jgi:hypothetical protein
LQPAVDVKSLHAKIGELTLENDLPRRHHTNPQASQEPRPITLLASSMDQHRDLGMREYLDRLAAEDERGDAVAAVRGHDDEVTAFRHRGIDDRL